jgi:hypothetical protein
MTGCDANAGGNNVMAPVQTDPGEATRMSTGTSHRLRPSELDRFQETYYERTPAVLPQSPMLASPDEAFDALVQACDAAATGRSQFKLFLDGKQAADASHPLLPRKGETTLSSYQTRLLAGPALPEFAVYCGSIQAYSPQIYDRARALLGGLFGDGWLPAGWIDMELFFGRYRYTPGGIHKEPRSNLHCVVAGQKSMLVWPEETWEPASVPVFDATELGRDADQPTIENRNGSELPGAAVLSGMAGDILYWPAKCWHVGISPDFSIGINIAVYQCEDPFELLTRAITGQLWRLSGDLGLVEEPALSRGSACELPLALERQLQALQSVAGSASLATALAVEWMKRVTGMAFRTLPNRRGAADLTSDHQALRKATCRRLLWKAVGEKLIYVGNGHAGQVRSGREAIEILEFVSVSHRFTMQELVDRFGTAVPEGDVRDIVKDLYAMRVLDIA